MKKEEVKALIAEKIKTNGESAITASVINEVMQAIVDMEPETPAGNNDVVHVNWDAPFERNTTAAMIVVENVAYEGINNVRIIPNTNSSCGWLYCWEWDSWRVIDDFSEFLFDGITWEGLINWAEENASEIATRKDISSVTLDYREYGPIGDNKSNTDRVVDSLKQVIFDEYPPRYDMSWITEHLSPKRVSAIVRYEDDKIEDTIYIGDIQYLIYPGMAECFIRLVIKNEYGDRIRTVEVFGM